VYLPILASNAFALFDTGAKQGNYITPSLAARIASKDKHAIQSVNSSMTVCGAFDSKECMSCRQIIQTAMDVKYNQMVINLTIYLKVVDLQHYDIILGYSTIQENPQLLRTMFLPEQLQAALNPVVKHGLTSECRKPSKRGDDDGFAVSSRPDQSADATHSSAPNEQPKRDNFDYGARARSGRRRQTQKLAIKTNDVIHEITDTAIDKADTDSEQGSVAPTEVWEPWLNTDVGDTQGLPNSSNINATEGLTPSNMPVNIFGSPQLQARIRQICDKHKKAFRRELVKEPARVPPLKIEVDTSTWHTKKNSMPPRPQSRLKHDEIRRQVDAMKAIGIIEDSQAAYWSQVLLTPKPNNKWRFCIDFRNLNEATKSFGWPIPNIPIMLQRFGNYKAQYFAIFDFTQGYFQCPISDDSRAFTAFITIFGLYQWCRVPMGLKSAGSYFQHVMSSLVLTGLMYVMLELYINDCIIFASSEDELCDRVKKILSRKLR
jgi:hypothetical protein